MQNGTPQSPSQTPLVWVLLGRKAGDNNQVLALAEALRWEVVEKHLDYIELELIPNRLLRVTTCGLRRKNSDPLTPPWPDLVISAGRRNEPVARWIKKQSGGRTKLVHMGRPWARPAHFDRIITTPQYNLDDAPNIIRNELPLHRIDADRMNAAAKEWEPRLRHLPRPWTAVLVGGDSSSRQFSAQSLVFLARAAGRAARESGGSLLVTTSARTPAGTLPLLKAHAEVFGHYHDYQPNDLENPYHGFLALADSFIVTAESTSMLTEACMSGKPVFLFDPVRPEHRGDPTITPRHEITTTRPGRRVGTFLRDRFGPKRLRRNIDRIHENLIARRLVAWLGDPAPQADSAAGEADLERAVQAVKELF